MKFDLDNPDPENKTVKIEISGLTEAQAIAIEEYMAVWKFIADKKFFYWTAFAIDGFLDWNIDIKFNGKEPQRFMKEIGNRSGKVKFVQENGDELQEEMYFLDYLKIKKALEEENNNGANEG